MQDSRKREIRIEADSFRVKCKISRYGIIDLFKECERLGYKLLRYPLGDHADLGFTVKKDNDIVIFTNSCSRLSREIFTLAHEIGHVILHLNDENSFIDDSITINGRSTDEKEQEANYFAACLLMPDDDVGRFIVSFDMVLNRLESLGKINLNQKLRLDNEKTMKKVGNLLRSVGGNAKLNEPSNVIDIPYEYIDYAIYNYNHNAVPKETLEKVLACYQLSIEDISDKLVSLTDDDDDDLDDLIGDLED